MNAGLLWSCVFAVVLCSLLYGRRVDATTGLSFDTRGHLAEVYTPQGVPSFLLPLDTGNGWTVEMWLTYQTSPGPPRTRALFMQLAPTFCTTPGIDTFEYSIVLLPTGFVRAIVDWCAGSFTLDSLQPLPIVSVRLWTHLSVVFQRNKGIFMYFDGTLENASELILVSTNPNFAAFTWSSTAVFNNSGMLELFDDTGLIDEMRFWQQARSSGNVHNTWCQRMKPGGPLTAIWNFDSNLGPDHVTRVDLGITYDIDPIGQNHLLQVPPLTPLQLPRIEPHFCPAPGNKDLTTADIVTITVCSVFGFFVVLVWVLAILIAYWIRSRRPAERRAASSTLAGAVSSRLTMASSKLVPQIRWALSSSRHAKSG